LLGVTSVLVLASAGPALVMSPYCGLPIFHLPLAPLADAALTLAGVTPALCCASRFRPPARSPSWQLLVAMQAEDDPMAMFKQLSDMEAKHAAEIKDLKEEHALQVAELEAQVPILLMGLFLCPMYCSIA
jgi:hypothetical protein